MAKKKVTTVPEAKSSEDEIVSRRRAAVTRLETSGYAPREIADALLKLHMNGDSPLFTFVGPDNKPLAAGKLTYAEMRERAFQTVRKDLHVARGEDGESDVDPEKVEHERWLLLRRLRKHMRKIDETLYGDPEKQIPALRDAKEIAGLMKPAIEIAVRIARLGGIESDKPMEIKFPELFVATIDEDGIVQMKKEPWDGKTEPAPEKKKGKGK